MESMGKPINRLFKLNCVNVLDNMGNASIFKSGNYTKITLNMEKGMVTFTSTAHKFLFSSNC